MIHCIGDSHVYVFSGVDAIPPGRDIVPSFRTYRLGPHTAYNALRHRDTIHKIIDSEVQTGDAIMFCFGEIDCRAHMVKQSHLQRKPLEEVVRECVKRYFRLFEFAESYGFPLLAWNVPPTSPEPIDFGEFSTYGSVEDRNKATVLFNSILQEYCEAHDITFLSIYNKLLDKDGSRNPFFFLDAIHLSKNVIPLVTEELKKKGVLPGKTLVCCGVEDIGSLIALRPNFDRVFCLDSDSFKIDYLKKIFRNDENVHVVHRVIDTHSSKFISYSLTDNKYSENNNYTRMSTTPDTAAESHTSIEAEVETCNISDFCKEHKIQQIDTLTTCLKGASLTILCETLRESIYNGTIKNIYCRHGEESKQILSAALSDEYTLVQDNGFKTGGICLAGTHWQYRPIAENTRAHNTSSTKSTYIFNVIYAHGPERYGYTLSRGNVHIVLSSIPIVGCHLYAYVNAYSFYGRQKGHNVLFLTEPIVVLPGQFHSDIWRHFDHIFTHYDYLLDLINNSSKALMNRTGLPHLEGTDDTITEDISERRTKYPVEGRRNMLCMISGNKSSSIEGELYSLRFQAAEWFSRNSDFPLDVYGSSPFSLPNYKGTIPFGLKLSTFAQYRYALCFENSAHPKFSLGCVDKILDCMETRTVPVYYGAPNIERYIPSECFIDFRNFSGFEELNEYLRDMPYSEYMNYVEHIDSWASRGGLRSHSMYTFYDQLCYYFAHAEGIELSTLFHSSAEWNKEIISEEIDKLMQPVPSNPYWSYAFLSKTSSPLLVEETSEDSYMTHVDNARSLAQTDRTVEAIEELEQAFSTGIVYTEDLYFCAGLYISMRQFDAAEKKLLQLISIDPSYAKAYDDLGVLKYRSNHFKQALRYFIQAHILDNFNFNALNNILSVSRQLDLPDFGNDIVLTMIKEYPSKAEFRHIAAEYNIEETNTSLENLPLPQTSPTDRKDTNSCTQKVDSAHPLPDPGKDTIREDDISQKEKNVMTDNDTPSPEHPDYRLIVCDQRTNQIARTTGPMVPIDADKLSVDTISKADHKKTIAIIFSKDRPMQLDATIRSLVRHCSDPDRLAITVIYKTSHNLYAGQYHILKENYPFIRFVPEFDFRKDLLKALSPYMYVLFLVDDNLFIRAFEVARITDLIDHTPRALGFSLRLGRNTSYCYMQNRTQSLPAFAQSGAGILKFKWTTAESDFGYPLEVSSSLYATQNILSVLKNADFNNPNTLEVLLSSNTSVFAGVKDELLCFETSVAFCNPVNMVQTQWANRAGTNTSYGAIELAQLFDEGYRINIDSISGFIPNSCHQEVEFNFEKRREEGTTMDQRAKPLASIIILSFNGKELIQACLESIARNTPEPYEIIVVDNAKMDGSLEYLRSLPNIYLIENPENKGPAVARAQAMSIASGTYLAFLDDDTIVTRGWLLKFIEITQSNPEIAMIGAVSNYASGDQVMPGSNYSNLEELEAFAKDCYENNRGKFVPTARLVSFCLFITPAVVEKIGTFDTRFGLFGFEDDDFSLRAHIAGLNPIVAKEVFIHHTGGPQGRGNKAYNERLQEAWIIYKAKWELDQSIPYGRACDMSKVMSQPFDKTKHYVALPDIQDTVQLMVHSPLHPLRGKMQDVHSGQSCNDTCISLAFAKQENYVLLSEFLRRFQDVCGADTFIETGTFLGNTAAVASSVFGEVHTIELSDSLHRGAVERLKNIGNIRTYHGRSADVLPVILKTVTGKIIFWLDAHYSGDDTAGSDTDATVLNEISAIRQCGLTDAIILVDDVRCFPDASHTRDFANGYPSLEEVCRDITTISDKYSFAVYSDILIGYPDNMFNFSPIVKACTVSRLFNGTNYDAKSVIEAENIIRKATGTELAAIERIYNVFADSTPTSGYYRLWLALVLLQHKKYPEALNELADILSLGFYHWRLSLYMAECFVGLHHFDKANETIDFVLRENPGNNCALEFRRAFLDIPQTSQSNIGFSSIIICDTGDEASMVRCINSLKQWTPELHEVLILKETENIGSAIQRSSTEYIVVLDSRTVLTEGWLAGLITCVGSQQKAGLISPVTSDMTIADQVQAIPTDDSELQAFTAAFKERNLNRRAETTKIWGPCALFRRSLVEEIGIPDTTYGDISLWTADFSIQAVLAGYSNYVAGDVFVVSNVNFRGTADCELFNDKWNNVPINSANGRKAAALITMSKARGLYMKDRLSDAIAALMEGIKFAPDEKEVYILLARILLDAKLYDDVISTIRSMSEIHRDLPEVLNLMGCAMEALNRDEEATICETKMFEQLAAYPPAYNLKGLLSYKKGNKREAFNCFEKAASLDHGYADPYRNMGLIEWNDGNYEDAVKFLERAFVLEPQWMDNAVSYHIAAINTGTLKRAEELFRDAIVLYPSEKRISFILIDLLLKQEKFQAAMAEIERAMLVFDIDDGILTAALDVRRKIGPLTVNKTAQEGTLSVCMITKNEERYIAKCLASLTPIADEIIIIDTGSTDRTKLIAEAYGAQVSDMEWKDDFAEARNASLERAKGRWILIHDGDEVISARDYKRIRETVRQKQKKPAAYTLTTRNYTNNPNLEGWIANRGEYPNEEEGTGWTLTRKVRLITNNKNIRFQNKVHELLEYSLAKLNIKPVDYPVPIHHYGKLDADRLTQRAKMYYEMGKKKLNSNGDLQALRELAVQAAELEKFQEAVDLWKQYLTYRPDEPSIYINLSTCYLELYMFQEALDTARRAAELNPASKEALLGLGAANLCAGHYKDAVKTLEALVSTDSGYYPAIGALAAAYCINGNSDEGTKILKEMRSKRVDYGKALYSLAKKLVQAGKPGDSERLLRCLFQTGHAHPDSQALMDQLSRNRQGEKGLEQ